MQLSERITAFVRLGEELKSKKINDLQKIIQNEHLYNPWFITPFVQTSIDNISLWLEKETLENFLKKYYYLIENEKITQNIGIVMAGNIPLVGFHDFLCVLLAGEKAICKLSSDDKRLLPAIVAILLQIEPRFSSQIHFVEQKISSVDKIIATGSDVTMSMMATYFANIPTLLRGHRNSIAVLDGNENDTQLSALTDALFLYFGMGCRSVSKIYIPHGYDFKRLFQSIDNQYKTILSQHHKYLNNLEYQKVVHLIDNQVFLDQGVSIFKEDEKLHSPLSVVHYQFYGNKKDLYEQLSAQKDKIQCMCSNVMPYSEFIAFENAQQPCLYEFANEIDTLHFILNKE